jgi:hypothetical protein
MTAFSARAPGGRSFGGRVEPSPGVAQRNLGHAQPGRPDYRLVHIWSVISIEPFVATEETSRRAVMLGGQKFGAVDVEGR